MSDMESKMYKKLLSRSADWKNIAFDLGFDINTVKVISQENPHDVKACLRDMCAKWVQKYPDRSLKDVDEALNSLHTSNSVPQTRKKGYHWFHILSVIILVFVVIILFLLVFDIYTSSLLYPVDSAPLDREFRFQPIVPGVESYNTTSKYKIPVNKTITDSLKTFEESFLYLLSNIQVSLYRYVATDEKKLELLEIVLSNWFNVSYYQPDSDQKKRLIEVHNFFLGIKQFFNFMDVSFLGMLDKRFLNGKFSSSLASYEESLDHFMTSTPIINLTNLVWTVHTEQNNIDIVLKLGPYWNHKNLKNLQKLILYVFGADASLMRLISIHHSVLTVTYKILNSSHMYQSVEWNIRHNYLLLLKWSVVSKVSVGGEVFFNVDYFWYNDTSEALIDVLHTLKDQNNAIRFLVAIGADVNYNGSSVTPLMAAVVAGNKAAVTTLLNLNADPNIVDPVSRATTLMTAIWNNDIEIVETLLRFKANPNIVFDKDNFRQHVHVLTTEMTYKSPLLVQILLEYGADPNYNKSIFGYPLHVAVNSGCKECVEILLKYIADPNVKDRTGRTPLHYAVSGNRSSIVHSLLQYNVNHNVTIDYIISLHNAVVNCHDEIFGLILSVTGINVNVTFEGITLLILASGRNCLPIIRLLFQHNADPMVFDELGYTSLHRCIVFGYSECVNIHLEFGVDPNIRTMDEYGHTPLILATIHKGQLEIMKLLFNKNAKVNIHSGGVKLLLSVYFQNELQPFSLVNMLHCSGISPLIYSIKLNRVDLVNLLLEHGADPNSCFERLGALGIAIDLQQFQIIDILLKHNASVNGLYHVHPPLYLAVRDNNVNIVKTLLNHGADVNIQVDTFNRLVRVTPLILATYNGNIKMVELLLMKGANVTNTMTNTDGITAIDIANEFVKASFGYSPLSIDIARRYLMIKKLLSFYIQKQQQETEDDSEQLLSSLETKHTHSNSSIYELVYEAEYVLLKNEYSSAIRKKIDSLRSFTVMRSYTQHNLYFDDFLPTLLALLSVKFQNPYLINST